MDLPYHLVDVFTSTPLEGNPLAVFPDATALDSVTMQRIAREMNLSETTFILPAESRPNALRVRIFTPNYEMEFAGHPTIGTSYVARQLGMVAADQKRFALLENIGPVNVRVDAGPDPMLWLTTPQIRALGTFPRDLCATALSLDEADLLADIPCELLTAGNPNVYVALKDQAAVDRAVVNTSALLDLIRGRSEHEICLFAFTPTKQGAYSRMFAPLHGVVEDPATGSATGPLAAFMMKHRLAADADGTAFISEQGTKMGRRSLLHILVHGAAGKDGIEIGGNVVSVATATLRLP
jgi:trans-2,3-dihydro-3-hydroxyanthranilate isomerase